MTPSKRGGFRNAVDQKTVNPEHGFTLVELIVYVSLLLVVLVIVAGLLINSLKSEQSVRSAAEASNVGLLIATAIQADVRNATALNVSSPDIATTGIAGTQLLAMRTLKGDGAATSVCSAWLYVPAHGGQLFTAESTATIPVPSVAYLASTPADKPAKAPTGWSSYGEGVARQLSASVPPVSVPVFTLAGQELTMAFDVSAPGRKAIPISTSETSRQTLTGTSTCF